MYNVRRCTSWGLAVAAILLSPVIVIFFIPLMIGIGYDVFDLVGEIPFALALCAPAAYLLLRLVPRSHTPRPAAATPRPRLPMIARPG